MGPCPFLFVLGVLLTALSGVPGLFMPRGSMRGQHISVALAIGGALLGLVAVVKGLVGPPPFPSPADLFFWDPLSCFFLVGVFLLSGLGSIYGLHYWRESEESDTGRKLRFFYGLIVSGMACVVVARHTVVFLMAWEVMALSAFFLVSVQDEKKESREAGWVYFAATHVSTLVLFAFFAVHASLRGSLFLSPFAPGEGGGNALFLMALVAFGLKAGVFPLHVWLPSAHANAPSHVSAILSAVLLKVGIYGLVRVCSLFPTPPFWWGTVVVALGVGSSVLGVVFAIGQHDLKRLLAYHSIENIGIIFLGLGLALWGRSTGSAEWVFLGLAGCLLHVWNHGLFKAALFYAAGNVIHATHTRTIDALGGLAKRMPLTSLAFLLSAVAICGLPPLNGFISEFLVYLGLFKTLPAREASVVGYVAIPALALTGALALACFTKVYGVVFLGEPRTEAAAAGKEVPWTMRCPLWVLTALCVLIGLFPQGVMGVLRDVAARWDPALALTGPTVLETVPWGVFTLIALLLWLGLGLGLWALRRSARAEGSPQEVPTWDCGYSRPTPSMQYTASSYAETLVSLFRWILVPSQHRKGKGGLFPTKGSLSTHVPETVLDLWVMPVLRSVGGVFVRLKRIQLGYLQVYVAYILLALVTLILLNQVAP